jgi:hypothetical protein
MLWLNVDTHHFSLQLENNALDILYKRISFLPEPADASLYNEGCLTIPDFSEGERVKLDLLPKLVRFFYLIFV